MDSNTDDAEGANWAKAAVVVMAMASACLICILFSNIITLFGFNYDSPPTWFWAVTTLLGVLNIATIIFLITRAVQALVGRAVSSRAVPSFGVLVLALGIAHIATACTYTRIPQWDFQDGLFDDLSWGPGKISQECQPANTNGEQYISYEEVERIARLDDWRVRNNELSGKISGAWHGWITELSRHGYYSNPEHRLLVVTMDDPYQPLAGDDRSPVSAVVVSYFSAADITRLAVGQEVFVCGQIRDATLPGGLSVSISQAMINPLPMPEEIASTEIPSDFLLEHEAHGCGQGYACPEYNIQIDAGGSATYNGLDNVTITGTHTMQVPPNKLRELVSELQRTNFLSVEGMPDRVEGSLQGATVLRVRMDGKSKTIALPWSSGAWPHAVGMITAKIEEVTNLGQWVKLVRSP